MYKHEGMNAEQGEELHRKAQEFQLPQTRFNFLNDHYGLRNGKWHVLLGTQGSGKSTLARSILLDTAAQSRITLYSSEESYDDTIVMAHARGKKTGDLEKINFIHEEDLLKKVDRFDSKEWARNLAVQTNNFGSKALFIDNITTSNFYSQLRPDGQVQFLSELRTQTKLLNIPVFIVAHTAKHVKDDQLISGEDVRYSGTLTNSTEYLYAYQKLTIQEGSLETSYGFVRIKKARGLGNVDRVYALDFDHNKSEYWGDKKISFQKFNEVWGARLRLGQKPR